MYAGVDVPGPVGGGMEEFQDKPYRQRLVAEWNRRDREYPGDEILELRRIYWGMVSYIDDEFGKLMDTLREQGLDEDTVVVFTSDHGDYMGDHGMIRKGPHLYEQLTHVPLLFRWPGRIEPRRSSAFVENIDLMPTLCDLAGVEFKDDHLHGRSFAPVLTGSADAHREAVFMEHGDVRGEVIQPGDLSEAEYEELQQSVSHHLCWEIRRGAVKGVRTDRWKYCYTPGDVDELYDLENDPNELNNLAGDPARADVCREHRALLMDWLIRTEDTLDR
jgi:arylsulfatase A-like enzyme